MNRLKLIACNKKYDYEIYKIVIMECERLMINEFPLTVNGYIQM